MIRLTVKPFYYLYISLVATTILLSTSYHARAYAQGLAQQESSQEDKTNNSEQDTSKEKATEKEKEADTPAPTIKKQLQRSKITIADPVDFSQQQNDDLTHYVPKQQIQKILVGPDEHLTLVETNAAPNSKGVFILLPDWQQSSTSPKAFNALRKHFPQHGWTTITIQPPNKPENYPSHATEHSQQETENKEIISNYQQQLAKILSAVNDKAKTYPGIIVLVSAGHHASLVSTIYQQELSEKPMAFISLSGYLEDDIGSEVAAKALAEIDLPTLDLYLKTDNRLVMKNIMLRKKAVNQELKSNFRQKQLFNIHTGFYPAPQLFKEINGWLKSIGW